MKTWEAKFLGLSAPWWLVLQMLIPGYAQSTRALLGGFCLLSAFMIALCKWAPDTSEEGTVRLISSSFLTGIASMILAPFVIAFLYVLVGALASIAQVLGVG
jgi:hypothetical protein